MNDQNFSFKPSKINSTKNFLDNPINANNIKSDLNTTDANSSNLQDIVQKQQKLYEDIKTLSSNINLNIDLNQNNNNNNINDYYQLSADINLAKSQTNNKQIFENMPRTTKSNIQSEKINELIHKFNNIYSSEKSQNANMVSNNNNNVGINSNEDEQEVNIQDFFSINNSDLNGNFDRNNNLNNNNNISYDNIYNNKNNSKISNRNISNKSSDNIVSTNSTNNQNQNQNQNMNMNNFDNKKEMHSYHKRSSNYNKIRLNYFAAKNKLLNRPINIHSYAKNKSYSTTQTSKSYNAIKDKRKIGNYYTNQNRDNDPDISRISEKANMVINEFKKTLMEAEKVENELNRSKYSLKTFCGFGANGNYNVNNMNNTFDTYNTNNNNNNLNQTNDTDAYNTNSFINTNNNHKNKNRQKFKKNNKNKNNFNNNNNQINEDEYMYEENDNDNDNDNNIDNNNNYENDNDNYNENDNINDNDNDNDNDEIEKLKIQNQMLIKSNMALKNKNKILTHEINTYKNSSIYKNPFTQYDQDLNAFIQDLKLSLDNATQNNEELENIIISTQNENKMLSSKNKELISNFELAKNECEKMTKENSELKVELENRLEEINVCESNVKELQKEIKNLNNIINNNNNQINYLNDIQESNKLSQKDNEDLILELKNTIENLQKVNLDNNNEIIDLKNKIEECNNNMSLKQNEINALNDNINEKELIIKNKDNQINEYNDIINVSNNKNIQNKNELQNLNIEREKLKNEIKTIKMLLSDRERTISSLKNSISFLTKTFNKNINTINSNINEAMANDDNENFDTNKGLKLIVEKMQKEIGELNKKNNEKEKERIRLEKEMNDFNEQYEQIKYDYQLLYQKYIEQNKIIEMIKKEFLKRNNENELQHLTKVNFDILAKLKQSQNENIIKSQQLEKLKKNYEIINNQLIEFSNNQINYNNQLTNSTNKINENENNFTNEFINNENKRKEDLLLNNNNDNNTNQNLNDNNNININNDMENNINNVINSNINNNINNIINTNKIPNLEKKRDNVNDGRNIYKLNDGTINENENDNDNDNEDNNMKLSDYQNIEDNLLQYSNENHFEKFGNMNEERSEDINYDINSNINKDISHNDNSNYNDNDNNNIENLSENDHENDNKKINENINNILKENNKLHYNYDDEDNNNTDIKVSQDFININEKNNTNDININTQTIDILQNAPDKKNNMDKMNNNINNNLNSDENISNNERFYTCPIKLTSHGNENYSEDIKEKMSQSNDDFVPVQNKYKYISQIELNKMNLNDLEMPTINSDYKSNSMGLPKSFNNSNINNISSNNFKSSNISNINFNNVYQRPSIKELDINDNLSEQNENNMGVDNAIDNNQMVTYQNIYTLNENKIICFNLYEKKFILINPKDKTNGVFDNYISKVTSPPLTLNTNLGFFILLDNYIFHYNELNNTINILNQLITPHKEGGFIYLNNEIYSISGKDCLQCEKYSIKKNINIKLPSVNYARINSGLCNINNEYLYIFFGNKCDNSIERLNLSIDYETMSEYINNWEYMQINNAMENGDKISLERFTLFLDDYNNVIILGGNDSKGNINQDIYGLNLDNTEIGVIGKIDTSALYIGQNIQIDDSIFAIYDSRNGLHFFNKELDYHEIYNFNL